MIIRIRGLVIAFAVLFLLGAVYMSHPPPKALSLWEFGYMAGLLVLAALHQLLSIRSKGHDRSLMIGRLFMSLLLSIAIGVGAVALVMIIERPLAAAGTGWGNSASRAAWYGLAVLAFSIAVSPGVSSVRRER